MFTCKRCIQSPSAQKVFSIKEFPIYECRQCHHRFTDLPDDETHVEAVYGDDYFEGGKDGYPDYLREGKLLIERGEQYGKIVNNMMKPGKILDVGAAAGFLLKGFLNTGWQGVGIEPNARMAQYGCEQLHLDIRHTSVEAFSAPLRFDLVSMIQVIPHFYNLEQALRVLSEHTRPGGYWLIETWNKDSFTAKIMGKAWHEYSPPSVLHWFSPKSLTHFAEQLDFHPVARGRLPKKLKAAHAKSLVSHKLEDTVLAKPVKALMKVIPDGLSLPYPSEDLFWMVFQKGGNVDKDTMDGKDSIDAVDRKDPVALLDQNDLH